MNSEIKEWITDGCPISDRPDLRRADLTGAGLSGADLSGADMYAADLNNADLREADLTGADLSIAYLHGAIMTDATWDEHTKWPAGYEPKRPGGDVVVSPLGIIALFAASVYAIAGLVFGFSSDLETIHKTIFIMFLTIFPVLMLGVFAWLVSRHPTKLYSPSEKVEKMGV